MSNYTASTLLNPTAYDLRGSQSFGLRPNAYEPDDLLRFVAKTFSAFQDKPITDNVISYLNGFEIKYEYHESDVQCHKFIIQPGVCIIDNQLIEIRDIVVYTFDNATLEQNEEYEITVKYKYIDQYHEEFAKILIQPVSTKLNDTTLSSYLTIATFTTNNREPYDKQTWIYDSEFKTLPSTEQPNYIKIDLEDIFYYKRGINNQKLSELYLSNYTKLFESLENNFKNVATDLGITKANYYEVPYTAKVPNETFVQLSDNFEYVKITSDIASENTPVGLYKFMDSKEYIFTSGLVTLEETTLIPNAYYYLDENGDMSTTYSIYKLGQAITNNTFNIQFEIGTSFNLYECLQYFGNVDLFKTAKEYFDNTTLIDTKLDSLKKQKAELNNIKDGINADYKVTNPNNPSTNLDAFLNIIDDLNFKSYDEYVDLTYDQKLYFELILKLLHLQIESGVSDKQYKSSYFNNPDTLVTAYVDDLKNQIIDKTVDEELLEKIKTSTEIVDAIPSKNSEDNIFYEDIVFTQENDLTISTTKTNTNMINFGSFYVSTVSTGNLLKAIYKIVLQYKVNDDLIIYFDDGKSVLVEAGSNTGSYEAIIRENDIYLNENNYSVTIIDMVGPDKDNVIFNKKSISTTIPDVTDITTLDIKAENQKLLVTHQLTFEFDDCIENSPLKGRVFLKDHNGNRIKINSIKTNADDTDNLAITIQNSYTLEEKLVILNYDDEYVDFEFDIPNDLYLDKAANFDLEITSIVSNVNNIKNDFSISISDITNDNFKINIPLIHNINDTTIHQTIIKEDPNGITYLFELSNPNKSDLFLYLKNSTLIKIPGSVDNTITSVEYILPNPQTQNLRFYQLLDQKATNSIKGNGGFENIVCLYEELLTDLRSNGIGTNNINYSITDIYEGNNFKVLIEIEHALNSDTIFKCTLTDVKDNSETNFDIRLLAGKTKIIYEVTDININDNYVISNSDYIFEINDLISNSLEVTDIISPSTTNVKVKDTLDKTFVYSSIEYANSTYSYSFEFSKVLLKDYNITTPTGTYTLSAGSSSYKIPVNFILEDDFNIIQLAQPVDLIDKTDTFENLVITTNPLDLIDNSEILDPNQNKLTTGINKSLYLYRQKVTCVLSNIGREEVVITLCDIDGFNPEAIIIPNLTGYLIKESYEDAFSKLFILDIKGGSFEYLQINNELEMFNNTALEKENYVVLNKTIDEVSSDLNILNKVYLKTNISPIVSEDEYITITCTLTRTINNDLTVYFKNNEIVIIKAGDLSGSVKTKNINQTTQYYDDNLKNDFNVENYITSIKGNQFTDIVILNDKTNALYTKILDKIDYSKVSLNLKIDYDFTKKELQYIIELSEFAKMDLIVILNNGVTLELLRNSNKATKIVKLLDHSIINITNVFGLSLEKLLSTPSNLVTIINKISPLVNILNEYYEKEYIFDDAKFLTSSFDFLNKIYEDINLTDPYGNISLDDFEEYNKIKSNFELYNKYNKKYGIYYTAFQKILQILNQNLELEQIRDNEIQSQIEILEQTIDDLSFQKSDFLTNNSYVPNNINVANSQIMSTESKNNSDYNYYLNKLLNFSNLYKVSYANLDTTNNSIITNKDIDTNKDLVALKEVYSTEIKNYKNLIINTISKINPLRALLGYELITYEDADDLRNLEI